MPSPEPKLSPPAVLTSPRELPKLPIISDATLVKALAEAERQDAEDHRQGSLPFGAVLPNPALLVREAILGPPPKELHLQFQRHVGRALGALAAAAGAVAAAAGALSPRNDFNAFRQVSLSTSDPSVVTGKAFAGAHIASYTIAIQQLATPQENVGELLAGEAPAGLEPGEHSFELRTRTGSTQLAVTLSEGDTNNSALTHMAAAINQANLGVIATLARPSRSTIQLAVTSSDTGSASAFTIADLNGWLVRASGISRLASQALDAVYLLEGIRTVAPTNQVPLQGGRVQLTLLATSRGVTQRVNVGPDRTAVTDAVSQLVEAMSRLLTVVNDHRRSFSRAFLAECDDVISSLRPGLQGLGVEFGGDAQMTLNRSAFEYMFDSGPEQAEALVTAPDGVAQRIGQFVAEIMAAPVSRLGAPEFIPPVLPKSSHPTPQMALASNTLSALLYAQLFAQGLFINSLF
jgi:hypothetical protein